MGKKFLHISNIILGVVLAMGISSCSNDDESEILNYYSGRAFTLNINSVKEIQTRSAGETDLNESVFHTLDYYFFAVDENNAAVGNTVFHDTQTGLGEEGSEEFNGRHTYKFNLEDNQLKALFGDDLANNSSCFIYVVANMPADVRTSLGNTPTLAAIQKKDFTTDFTKNEAQPDFVMYGGKRLTLNVDGENLTISTYDREDIPVARDAAKIDLIVTNVQDYIYDDETDPEHPKPIWKAMPETMYVSFYNGVNRSFIASQSNNHIEFADADYFNVRGNGTTGARPLKAVGTEYHHDVPFYSYLSDWNSDTNHGSYIILRLYWKKLVDDEGNPIEDGVEVPTYYQIPTSTNKWYYENRYYQIKVNIGMMGSLEEPEPVLLKDNSYIIVNWGSVMMDAPIRENIFLIVKKDKEEMNNEKQGKVEIATSHPAHAVVRKVEYFDYSAATIYKWTIEKGEFGTQNGQQLVYRLTRTNMTNNNTDIYYLNQDGQNYRSNRWRTEYQSYKTTFDSFIPSTDETHVYLTHDIPDNMYVPYDITVDVTNDKISTPQTVVFTQYPAIYIVGQRSNGYVFVNGYNNTSDFYYSNGNYIKDVYDNRNNKIGTLVRQSDVTNGTGANNNPNNYIINISALSSSSDKAIGNVRGERNNLQYLNLNDYHPGKKSADTKVLVAPSIMIASSYAKTQPMTKESAEKRCASYQENGYPAGRWRLPTYAEVEFIVGLSNAGHIPSLFETNINNGYWCSYGRIYGPTNNTQFYEDSNINVSVRCVYDIWYWGEEHATGTAAQRAIKGDDKTNEQLAALNWNNPWTRN